jgi:hypothetical protein
MAKTTYFEIKDVAVEWVKVREEDRDMGPQDGSDVATKIDAVQGRYTLNIILTDEQDKELRTMVPTSGMSAQLFKTDKDGRKIYVIRREHFNPKFVKEGEPESGIVGPPEVFKLVDGAAVAWDFEEDGLIGNGSICSIKGSNWDNKKVTLQKILVTDLVVFEPEAQDGGY